MISEEELMGKIEEITKEYSGQLDHLYEAVGMVVIGRLLGWKVMRLVSSRRTWTLSNELFGDLKGILPERGNYAYKSVGLAIVDRLGGYWDVIKGKTEAMPLHKRKMLL
jgi:hypothetical protein